MTTPTADLNIRIYSKLLAFGGEELRLKMQWELVNLRELIAEQTGMTEEETQDCFEEIARYMRSK